MAIATSYTFGVELAGTVVELRPKVVAALKAEGFGILTEIDVAATMKAKLGIDGDPYLILGACNPPLAHKVLELEPSAGALLPCNVVLRERGGRTVVEIMDPAAVLAVVRSTAIEPVAQEARERLVRVVAALESGSAA